jgi:hypothetical protein
VHAVAQYRDALLGEVGVEGKGRRGAPVQKLEALPEGRRKGEATPPARQDVAGGAGVRWWRKGPWNCKA